MRAAIAVLLFSISGFAQNPPWEQIRILCVVRDAQGRPVKNLTQDRFEILEAGESRPIRQFAPHPDKPEILTIDNLDSLYLAVDRQFSRTAKRKVVVITAAADADLTP